MLVGHSYGGAVITNAAVGHDNVEALVYIAGFAPDAGESLVQLVTMNPGSEIGPSTLITRPYPLPDGTQGTDLYLTREGLGTAFAADVPRKTQDQMFATQRPFSEEAFASPSGEPAWKAIPSWYLVASNDRAIPPATQRFMAEPPEPTPARCVRRTSRRSLTLQDGGRDPASRRLHELITRFRTPQLTRTAASTDTRQRCPRASDSRQEHESRPWERSLLSTVHGTDRGVRRYPSAGGTRPPRRRGRPALRGPTRRSRPTRTWLRWRWAAGVDDASWSALARRTAD